MKNIPNCAWEHTESIKIINNLSAFPNNTILPLTYIYNHLYSVIRTMKL